MSNIPIFSYKQYLDDISRMKQTGTIGANQQVEAPRSAGSRGLKKVKDFIKDPVHMMGESAEGRPAPSQPNGIEEKVLDVETNTQEDVVDIDKNFQMDLMKYLNMKMVQIEKQIQDKPAKTPEEQDDKDFAVKLFKFVQQKLAQQDQKDQTQKTL